MDYLNVSLTVNAKSFKVEFNMVVALATQAKKEIASDPSNEGEEAALVVQKEIHTQSQFGT
jgi:hypothetical protein